MKTASDELILGIGFTGGNSADGDFPCTIHFVFFIFTIKFMVLVKTNNFFSVWVFFHEHSRITGLQGKEWAFP